MQRQICISRVVNSVFNAEDAKEAEEADVTDVTATTMQEKQREIYISMKRTDFASRLA